MLIISGVLLNKGHDNGVWCYVHRGKGADREAVEGQPARAQRGCIHGCCISRQEGTLFLHDSLLFTRLKEVSFAQVMLAIGDLFSGAQSIMNWLTLSARLIAKSVPEDRLNAAMQPYEPKIKSKKTAAVASRLQKEQMTSVVWTTPLGLPIVQPYRKVKRKQIMTSLQTVFISDPNVPASGG